MASPASTIGRTESENTAAASNIGSKSLVPLPMAVFLVDEVVGGVGECRRPPAIHQMGIPADMVDMQMGRDHGVDVVRLPDAPEIVEKFGVEHVEGRSRTVFGDADGRVDDEFAIRRLHQKRVDAHVELPVSDVVRREPLHRLDLCARQAWQQYLAEKFKRSPAFALDHFRDGDVADGPSSRWAWLRLCGLVAQAAALHLADVENCSRDICSTLSMSRSMSRSSSRNAVAPLARSAAGSSRCWSAAT